MDTSILSLNFVSFRLPAPVSHILDTFTDSITILVHWFLHVCMYLCLFKCSKIANGIAQHFKQHPKKYIQASCFYLESHKKWYTAQNEVMKNASKPENTHPATITVTIITHSTYT